MYMDGTWRLIRGRFHGKVMQYIDAARRSVATEVSEGKLPPSAAEERLSAALTDLWDDIYNAALQTTFEMTPELLGHRQAVEAGTRARLERTVAFWRRAPPDPVTGAALANTQCRPPGPLPNPTSGLRRDPGFGKGPVRTRRKQK